MPPTTASDMRRALPLLLPAVLALAAGCGGPAAVKHESLSKADAAAIRERAESQQDDVDRAAGIAVPVKRASPGTVLEARGCAINDGRRANLCRH